MRLNLIRKIDFWLGIPLCFLFSIINIFLQQRSFQKNDSIRDPIRKILFIKLSELGAIILSYPLLKSIQDQYPHADLFFLTFEKNKDVFQILDGVIKEDHVITIREDSFPEFIRDTGKVLQRFHREKMDIIFDLEFFSRFTALLSYLIQAKKRIGFDRYQFEGLYRGNLMTHRIQYNPLR